MPKFKLTMVKEHRETGEEHKDNYLQHGNNFVGITFFDSPSFHNMSSSAKKKVVKNILKTKKRSDISHKYSIGKKERLIVNETGYYGLDKAIFDGKVKMPKHLVDNRKRRLNG